MVVYFNDILIYSKTEASHYNHVREVLTVLQANELYINLKKCRFLIDKFFLGHVVNVDKIHVDEDKVYAVKEWLTPKIVCGVRSFHAATFYQRFVQVAFTTEFLKKGRFS